MQAGYMQEPSRGVMVLSVPSNCACVLARYTDAYGVQIYSVQPLVLCMYVYAAAMPTDMDGDPLRE